MAALAIAQAIKNLIERHVDARTNLVQDIRVGDGGIWLQRADEFRAGGIPVFSEKKTDTSNILVVRAAFVLPDSILFSD